MGVPAFYRWISEKYGKIVVDMLEKRPNVIEGVVIPMNLLEPNPNGIEYDNLYVDMNGLIHPCSHPEDRDPPKSEEEMYINVTKYLDRLVAAVRPRRVLYLAVDGVAPRAKMNQQRSRRFRAAQDVKEKKEMMDEVIAEMVSMGYDAPEEKEGGAWDSNVITPGTEFMTKLSVYIRFYILDRMNRDPFWKGITVVFSDASEPGEGEHKIMSYIRNQRAQPGFDPNQRHILHGLDADLIMLALATHEAHFTILREKVSFGRKKEEPEISEGQRMLNAQSMRNGILVSCLNPQDEWVYKTPLQALHVNVLREYLDNEFSCLKHSLPFGYDLERVIDDFIFLCFFVGNDFLPHLPSLDIRDGALDFLIECYKELLPSLGDYLTAPGGDINLRQADVILGRVGEIEDQIFIQRKRAADNEERRRQERFGNRGTPRQGGAQAGSHHAHGHNSGSAHGAVQVGGGHRAPASVSVPIAASNNCNVTDNQSAAAALRQSLLGKRPAPAVAADAPVVVVEPTSEEGGSDGAPSGEGSETAPSMATDDDTEATDSEAEPSVTAVIPVPKLIPKSMTPAEIERAKEELKKRVKDKEQALIDRNKETIQDNVKLHEAGWKERYYDEQYKKENIERGGGLSRMVQTYVQGLCWVLKYYYAGVPSWNWYYPFHYAPFASDLRNIDSLGEIKFELSEPFRPIEQLLAVFPANSVKALPEPCHWLMTDPSSPIYDLYDSDIPIDPNGKHLPWLWILLLPFVDERRITAAFELCRPKLSLQDAKKNKFGLPVVFIHKDHHLGKYACENLRYTPAAETDTEVLRALQQENKKMNLLFDGTEAGGDGNDMDATSNATVTSSQKAVPHCEFEAATGRGISGVLSPPPPVIYAPLHNVVPAPVDATFAFQDIRDNQVVCFTYTLLPMVGIHKSELLPGVIPQMSILTQFDLQHRRPPRLNKGGFNIMDIYQSVQEKEQQRNRYNGGGGNNGYGNYSQLQYGFQPQYQQRSQYESQTMAYSGFKQPRSGGGAYGQNAGGQQHYHQQPPPSHYGPPQGRTHQQDRSGYYSNQQAPAYGAPPQYGAYGGQQAADRYPPSYQQPHRQYAAPVPQQYASYPPPQQSYHHQQQQQYPPSNYAPAPAPVEHTVSDLKDRHTQRAAMLGSHRVDRSVPLGAYNRPGGPNSGAGGRQTVFLDTMPPQPAPQPPAKFRHTASGARAAAPPSSTGGHQQFRAPPAGAAAPHSFSRSFQQQQAPPSYQQQPMQGAPPQGAGGGDSMQSIRAQLFQTLQQQQQQQQPQYPPR